MVNFYKLVDWYIYYIKDDENCIKLLFFTKMLSSKILKYNHKVLLLDATYKTKK